MFKLHDITSTTTLAQTSTRLDYFLFPVIHAALPTGSLATLLFPSFSKSSTRYYFSLSTRVHGEGFVSSLLFETHYCYNFLMLMTELAFRSSDIFGVGSRYGIGFWVVTIL